MQFQIKVNGKPYLNGTDYYEVMELGNFTINLREVISDYNEDDIDSLVFPESEVNVSCSNASCNTEGRLWIDQAVLYFDVTKEDAGISYSFSVSVED